LPYKKIYKTEIAVLYANYVASFLYPLILIPFLSRALGPENWGKIAIVSAYSVFIGGYVDYAFHLSGQRDISLLTDNKEREKLLAAVFSAKLIMYSCAWVLYLGAILMFGWVEKTKLYGCSMLIGGIGGLNFIWYLRGIGKNLYASLVEFFCKTLALIFAFAFVRNAADLDIYFIVQIAVALLLFVISVSSVRCPPFEIMLGIKSIQTGFKTFILHMSGTVGSLLPILILSGVSTEQNVGIYSAAEKITRSASGILDPFKQYLFPRMAAKLAVCKKNAAKELLEGFLKLNIPAIAVSASLLTFSSPIVNFLFGERFIGASGVLKILSLLPLLILAQNTFVVQWLLIKKREWALVLLQVSSYILVVVCFALCYTNGFDAIKSMGYSFMLGEMMIGFGAFAMFLRGWNE
jgi:polysaccharide transporter, PST family